MVTEADIGLLVCGKRGRSVPGSPQRTAQRQVELRPHRVTWLCHESLADDLRRFIGSTTPRGCVRLLADERGVRQAQRLCCIRNLVPQPADRVVLQLSLGERIDLARMPGGDQSDRQCRIPFPYGHEVMAQACGHLRLLACADATQPSRGATMGFERFGRQHVRDGDFTHQRVPEAITVIRYDEHVSAPQLAHGRRELVIIEIRTCR